MWRARQFRSLDRWGERTGIHHPSGMSRPKARVGPPRECVQGGEEVRDQFRRRTWHNVLLQAAPVDVSARQPVVSGQGLCSYYLRKEGALRDSGRTQRVGGQEDGPGIATRVEDGDQQPRRLTDGFELIAPSYLLE